MSGWSMKKDRTLIQLAREKPSVDQIAAQLEISPAAVLRAAKRLGICLKRDRMLKAAIK
jgi:biotin operon repressor